VAAGVEIVPEALRLARDHTHGILALAAGEALPFPVASFDRVACIGTLEHFTDPSAGAGEVARVLTVRGRALVVVPNRDFLVWKLTGAGGTEQQAAQELLLDIAGWTELLEGAGLAVDRVTREPWHTKPVRSPIRRLAQTAAYHLIPLRWTYQFAFICQKRRGAERL
jgi:SAM-dependent methyltransferase